MELRTIKTAAVLLLLLPLFTEGCYYDNEEELYPNTTCDTTNVTYSAVIQPIFSNRCYPCHSNATAGNAGNGVSFEGYANLSGYLSTGAPTLLGSIRHENGFTPMPQNAAALSACDIHKIEIWINQGYPDN